LVFAGWPQLEQKLPANTALQLLQLVIG